MLVGKFNEFLVFAVIFSEVTWGQYTEVTNVLVLRQQSTNTHSYGIGVWHLWYCLMQQHNCLTGSLSYLFSVLLDPTGFLCSSFFSCELVLQLKKEKREVTLLPFYWWENSGLTVTYNRAIAKLGLDCLLVYYFSAFRSCCPLSCTHFMVTIGLSHESFFIFPHRGVVSHGGQIPRGSMLHMPAWQWVYSSLWLCSLEAGVGTVIWGMHSYQWA